MPVNPLYPTQDFSGFNVIGLEGLQFDGNASLGNLNVDNLLVDDDFIALNNIIVLADTSNISVIDNETLLGMGLKNNSLGVETIFTSQANKGVSGTTSNNDYTLISNNTERILIKQDGNIGIGNSNPLHPLSVEGNIYSNNIVSLTASVNNLTGNVSNLQTRMNQAEGNISILNGNVSSLTTRVAGTEANISVLFTLSGNLDANVDAITTRLANIETEINTGNLSTLKFLDGNTFITGTGNFGIGTPTPTSKLQVSGNADITGSMTSNSVNTSGITLTPTTTNLNIGSSTTLQNKLNILGATSQDKFIRFRRGGAAPIGFSGLQFSDFDTHSFYQGAFGNTLEFTYASGNPTEQGNVGTPILTLNSFGNIGIGTNTPTGKFQVRTDTGNVSTIENTCDGTLGFQGISNTQGAVKSFYGSSNFIPGGSACLGSVSNHPALIGTNNTERMRILTDGNVGIGTSTPNQKLQVNGNINITGDYLINGTPIAASKWVQSGNDIYNTNTGNVGIGTSSPNFKLEVSGNSNLNGTCDISSFRHYDVGGFGFIKQKNIIDNQHYVIGQSPDGSSFINAGNSKPIEFRINNQSNSGFTLTPTGNVGIGTTTPNSIFSVSRNTFNLGEFRGNSSECGITIGDINAANYNSDDAGYMSYKNEGGVKSLRWGLRGIADRMTLDIGNGNLGIGTSSPLQKLSVVGNARITDGLTLFKTAGQPNLIFESDQGITGSMRGEGFSTAGNAAIFFSSNIALGWQNNRRMIMNFDNNHNYRQGFEFDANARNLQLFTTSGDSGASIIFRTQTGVGNGQVEAFYGTERMRITGDGNLGIGTSTPNGKLHIDEGRIQVSRSNISSDYLFLNDKTNNIEGGVGINKDSPNQSIYFFCNTNHSIRFGTNNTERMRITADGKIGLRNSNPSTEVEMDGFCKINGGLSCRTFNKVQVSGSPHGISGGFGETDIMSFFNSSSQGIVIEQNGDVKNTNNSYGAISDKRKKENITPATSQIEDFKKYNFVNYNLIDISPEKHLGLIAQDVLDISPGLVSYDEERDEYSVKYSILYLKACKCIQELIEKVEILENKISLLINETT